MLDRKNPEKIERAVYSHIQAVRTLGHKRINTEQIAEALGLPVSAVNATIVSLKRKGVKLA
jgi:hypothetical protein